MKINVAESTDEELVKFFIWDGHTPESAIEFVLKMIRSDMLPFTEDQMKELHRYHASLNETLH